MKVGLNLLITSTRLLLTGRNCPDNTSPCSFEMRGSLVYSGLHDVYRVLIYK